MLFSLFIGPTVTRSAIGRNINGYGAGRRWEHRRTQRDRIQLARLKEPEACAKLLGEVNEFTCSYISNGGWIRQKPSMNTRKIHNFLLEKVPCHVYIVYLSQLTSYLLDKIVTTPIQWLR